IKNFALEIPDDMIRFHKLDPEKIVQEGSDIEEVLHKFKSDIDRANLVFSFNLNYNESIVGAEFFRYGISHRLHNSEKYCLMQESTYFCKIDRNRKSTRLN